jgi:hypothetical protein
VLVLPISQNSAWFEFSCELEDVRFNFTFRWNDRDDCWYFDIGDAQESSLATGLKAVTRWPLLEALRSLPGLPKGELLVVDTAGKDEEPTFDSLGRRHLMFYVTEGELAQLAA